GNANGDTSGGLYFTNTQTVGGTGSIVLGGSPSNVLQLYFVNTVVTLGPNLTVRGKSGTLNVATSEGTAWVNQGTVAANVADGSITLSGPWTNSGTFRAQNGGTLQVQADLTNYANNTLTGGAWEAFANSTLRLIVSPGSIVTNAAAIVLDGLG